MFRNHSPHLNTYSKALHFHDAENYAEFDADAHGDAEASMEKHGATGAGDVQSKLHAGCRFDSASILLVDL